jgi:ribosomal-protein-serine acetyltransferase
MARRRCKIAFADLGWEIYVESTTEFFIHGQGARAGSRGGRSSMPDPIGETPVMSTPLSENPELRLLEESDAAELHTLIEANRDYLAAWMPWAATQTFADTAAFIRHTREQLLANNGFQLAILFEQRIVGVVGYHGVDWARRSTRIGYWLAERHQGHGTMTAAVGILVDHALSVWELDRVEIRAAAENRRSRAVAERLGF